MTRLHTQPISEATGQAAQLFSAIKSAVGMVPNAFVTMGSNSPLALEAFMNLDKALSKSSLSAKQIEVIKLVVSQEGGCDYCLGAHTMMAKKTGLSKEAILALRHEQPSGDASNDALANFTRYLVVSSGTASLRMLSAFKSAGFTDAQVIDTALAIASITFGNLVNRINDTVIDVPKAD